MDTPELIIWLFAISIYGYKSEIKMRLRARLKCATYLVISIYGYDIEMRHLSASKYMVMWTAYMVMWAVLI